MSRRRSSTAVAPPPAATADVEELVVLDVPEGEVCFRPVLLERRGLAIGRLDELGALPVDGARLDALRAQIAKRLARRAAPPGRRRT